MNHKTFIGLIFCLALIIVGCSKDSSQDQELAQGSELSDLKKATQGAIQLSGTGYYDADDPCNSPGEDADYSVILEGELDGCLYTFVDFVKCSPSGTYMEIGTEKFVGTYKGDFGTFETTYKFEAKYEGCNDDGSYVGAEIKGRCQHPIVKGKGTGVFEGVTGRLDIKDDIQTSGITYYYRGHLKGLNLTVSSTP